MSKHRSFHPIFTEVFLFLAPWGLPVVGFLSPSCSSLLLGDSIQTIHPGPAGSILVAPGTNAGQVIRKDHTSLSLLLSLRRAMTTEGQAASQCGPARAHCREHRRASGKDIADFCLLLFGSPYVGCPQGHFLTGSRWSSWAHVCPRLNPRLMFQALALAPASSSLGPRVQ